MFISFISFVRQFILLFDFADRFIAANGINMEMR